MNELQTPPKKIPRIFAIRQILWIFGFREPLKISSRVDPRSSSADIPRESGAYSRGSDPRSRDPRSRESDSLESVLDGMLQSVDTTWSESMVPR